MNVPEWTHRPYATDSDPDEVSPLLSQPVVELLLRIQTYLFMEGGRERMLARRAFASDLPPQLIARVSKGGQNDFSLQLLRQNESRIRELVLDGTLCKEGFLNRRKMDAVLASEYDSNTDGLMEILHTHLSVEIWLQSLRNVRI
jgi:asparagine synthase (glutamine-hydrolysing)